MTDLKGTFLPVAAVISLGVALVGGGIWVGMTKESISNTNVRVDKLEQRVADTPTMDQFNELKAEVRKGFDEIMTYLKTVKR